MNELRDNFEKLPKGQAEAILNIIDHKTNNDMKEVITKMDSEFKSIRNEIKIVYWVIGIAMAVIAYMFYKK